MAMQTTRSSSRVQRRRDRRRVVQRPARDGDITSQQIKREQYFGQIDEAITEAGLRFGNTRTLSRRAEKPSRFDPAEVVYKKYAPSVACENAESLADHLFERFISNDEQACSRNVPADRRFRNGKTGMYAPARG